MEKDSLTSNTRLYRRAMVEPYSKRTVAYNLPIHKDYIDSVEQIELALAQYLGVLSQERIDRGLLRVWEEIITTELDNITEYLNEHTT